MIGYQAEKTCLINTGINNCCVWVYCDSNTYQVVSQASQGIVKESNHLKDLGIDGGII
jgi:hypothetical protein